MPTAPPTHCHRPGHPAYTGRRCPLCAREFDRARGTPRQRGYDAEWQRVRAAFLAAHPVCSVPGCGARAVDVDHRVSVREAPHRRLDPFNLRSFCKPHHSQRTTRDQTGRDAQGRFAKQPVDGQKQAVPTVSGVGDVEFAEEGGLTAAESSAHSPGKWDFLL